MLENPLFSEKYRPKTFEDFIGISKYQSIVDFCKTPFKLPHFLFVGKPGTGKTTLGKIIIKTLNADSLFLNASDESGIETIRGKVKTFAKTMAFNSNVPKIIFLDEADFLGGSTSKTAMASLRGIIEEYKHVRFILSVNYEHKIIDALHSRLTRIPFGDYNKDEILNYLIKICNKENIKYEEPALKQLILLNYPDIREMVKTLGNLKEVTLKDIHSKNEIADNIYLLVQQKKYLEARKVWVEKNLDCKELLYYWFEKLINTSYPTEQKKEILDLIALTDYRLAVSATPDIQLFNFCVKVRL